MKKIFAILMAICMMASLLCVTAFAAGETYESKDKLPAPAADVVIRVTAIKGDKIVHVGDYTNFEDGWFNAIHEGLPRQTKTTKYERMIVDFYADWTSADDGNFTDDPALQLNSDGFNNDTIEIPDDVKITVNLNGHTIKRVLPDSISDGEVMYIDEDADVIINDGTITGGKSTNGAGGIHIHDANVTLNNVHIVGNIADKDDGGGIALYDGAVLVMNGGSFKDNVIVGSWSGAVQCYGGAIYVDDSKASFYDVEFRNNQTEYDEDYGAAIYVNDGEVYMNNCIVDGNGIQDDAKDFQKSCSIIHAEDSKLQIEKTTFTNNGGGYHYDPRYAMTYTQEEYIGFYSSVFTLEDSKLYISGDSKISNNNVYYIFFARGDSSVYATDTTITDNTAMVMWSSEWNEDDNYFKNCTFNNNKLTSKKIEIAGGIYDDYNGESFYFGVFENYPAIRVVFENCDMGDSNFEEWVLDYVKFVDCENTPYSTVRHFASIFGEGSLTTIFVFIAVIDSVVSIYMIVLYKKKKAGSATTNNAAEAEDKE